MTDYYQKIFIRDTRDYLIQLKPLLSSMESRSSGGDDIDKAFRIMHSIKSEAAHLRKKDIADLAHIAESVLHELKSDPKDEGHLNRLFEAVSRIEEHFSRENISSEETDSPEDEPPFPEEKNQESLERKRTGLSEFEMLLLKEARDRGETFYRMICEFEERTEMLYPKAVLILNNLEQIVNVIHCEPELSAPFEGEGIIPEYYFTTERPEKDLFNVVQVDQVKRVFLARLNWDHYMLESSSPKKREAGAKDSQLLIKRKDLVSLWYNYLKGKIAAYVLDNSATGRSGSLLESFDGVGTALTASRFIPFETGFQEFPEIIQRSAAEQGKEARCIIHGGEQNIERWFISRLRDSLVQLLRNAVSHGIEEPSVRLKAGKSPRGEVSLRYQRNEHNINIYIQDDGRGIAEDLIRKKAMELGMDASAPLLNIITAPGFSTSEIISLEAGRGIGLDIVAAEIARIAGATVSLEDRENHGARFCITIPLDAASRTIHFARYRQNTIAVDNTVFLGQEKARQADFGHDSDGRVRYRGCPVFTCEGYLFWSDNFVTEDTLIKIRNKTEDYYLLVEDLLFCETFPEDIVSLSEKEGGDPLSQLCIGKQETGISFLHSDDLFNQDRPGNRGD